MVKGFANNTQYTVTRPKWVMWNNIKVQKWVGENNSNGCLDRFIWIEVQKIL